MPKLRRPSGGLWANRDFVKLWSGQSISEFGSQISALAIPLLAATQLHASPLAFSLLAVLGFLPFILFALPAGVWVDRLRRRPILIFGDAGRAVLLTLVPVLWATHTLRMWHLLVLQFAIGIFTVFFDVAYQSYLPSLVERGDLVEGNAKLQTTASAAQTTGPPLAGVLVAALTAPYAIALDAVSFIVSTAFMIPIRTLESLPERAPEAAKPKMWPELKEGVRYVVGHRYLKWIALSTGASNFFGQIAFAIVILYMQRSLHMSAIAIGVVFAGFGAGAIVASITATRFTRLVGGIGNAIWMPAVVFSLGGLTFPLAPRSLPIPVLLTGTILVGYGGMAYNIAQVSLRQAITPERLQGRMNASMRWIVWGTIPLGTLVGGALATAYGLRAALWVGAIGSLFTFLPLLLSSVRSLEELPAAATESAPAESAAGIVEPTTSPLAGAFPSDAA
ncbi:MAG TPA: MFS transporter [Gaiellaceae bacterium]